MHANSSVFIVNAYSNHFPNSTAALSTLTSTEADNNLHILTTILQRKATVEYYSLGLLSLPLTYSESNIVTRPFENPMDRELFSTSIKETVIRVLFN